MKLLQINTTANWGSTGRIAEEIGQMAMARGWDSYMAYGRSCNGSKSKLIKIGDKFDMYSHGLQSKLFDNHGLASVKATKKFVEQIKEIAPDVIHLHNIHGYYLNYKVLFQFLKEYDSPVVWTFHDCWPFTGHCAYFTFAGCNKWKDECGDCPQKGSYPGSLFLDRSLRNYKLKKAYFNMPENMTLIPVSDWLHQILDDSFLGDYQIKTIHNGVNTEVFRPRKIADIVSRYNLNDHKMVLGVASVWEKRKGLPDIFKLRELLDDSYVIVVVGVNDKQLQSLPKGVVGIKRTNSVDELAEYYSAADVFINPTYEDNFPTTNIEALACGTPVVTYCTGGSPEAVDEFTGRVVSQGDIVEFASCIKEFCSNDRDSLRKISRNRALELYRKEDKFAEYVDLYERLLPLPR